MYRDRADAAHLLAQRFEGRELRNPLVLAIPRGGVPIGAVLARELGAELDVILSRKLRAPGRPELAFGAVSEDGRVFLNRQVCGALGITSGHLAAERRYQLAEIARRKGLFRG